jgi:hypothetical protein
MPGGIPAKNSSFPLAQNCDQARRIDRGVEVTESIFLDCLQHHSTTHSRQEPEMGHL